MQKKSRFEELFLPQLDAAYSWIKKKQRMEKGLVPLDEEIHVEYSH